VNTRKHGNKEKLSKKLISNYESGKNYHHRFTIGDSHGRLVGDPQILVGDPQILVGDPQILVGIANGNTGFPIKIWGSPTKWRFPTKIWGSSM